MNPARAAALLNGRAQSFSIGLGGDRITDQDIAHALGKLWHEGARLYGRAKWAGQEQYFVPLLAHFLNSVKALQSLDCWTDIKPGELERIAKLALVESLYPKLCSTCGGLGALMVEKQKRGRPRLKKTPTAVLKIPCPKCRGEGIQEHAEFALAKTAQVSRRRWANVWSSRYHGQIMPLVDKYERLFWVGIRRALRENKT